jgi:Tol biopolymer transport system component
MTIERDAQSADAAGAIAGLGSGTQVGNYQIDAVVGEGGTGIVFRATDTKLNRPVAIKFLADDLSSVAARRRFQREAQMASSLNHPHILTVHDVGEFSGRQYIVSELMDGGTLHDWARQSAHSWRKVIELLVGVADGLAAAHAANILHRDVKPTNVLLTKSGYAKLADFGVAKLADDEDVDAARRGADRTVTGAVIGTIAYMSPEQACGAEVDARSDVFSLGIVLFELLSGRPPFDGATAPDVLRTIMHGTPLPLSGDIPEALRLIVEKALAKEPDERYQSMREMVVDLRRVLRRSDSATTLATRDGVRAVTAVPPRRWRLAWLALPALAVLGTTAAWLLAPGGPTVPVPELRFEVATPPVTDATSLAISPDGQTIVFEATVNERSQLWLHSLQSLSARPLPGTESASFPFWSPDNKSIGFFADGKLKRIDVDSGLVRTLANSSIGRGGAWSPDGIILFAPGTNDPLQRVSALGGEPVTETQLAVSQAGHRFPQFLPDGRHFLYFVTGDPDSRGVAVADLEGTETRRLLDADTAAVFSTPEQLLFGRRGTLYAQRFDAVRRELSGTAIAMPEEVAVDSSVYRLALSASMHGSVIYRTASAIGERRFTWFDRAGTVLGSTGEPMEGGISPSMSPDGCCVAFSRSVNGNQDIWLLDLDSGDVTRFTFDAGIDFVPLWSPDGQRILFSSNRSGAFDLYEKPATGAGAEELVLATQQNKFAVDWSSDGEHVLYVSNDPQNSYDIWALPLADGGSPFAVVQTPFEERDAQFSPDGQWIAYQSNESGRLEVYVQPFLRPGGRWQISTDGGAQVRWRRDGAEVFYVALDGRLMAVAIRFVSQGQAIEVGAPTATFSAPLGRGVQTSNRQQYMVSPDGQRFLMNVIADGDEPSSMRVVLNFKGAP